MKSNKENAKGREEHVRDEFTRYGGVTGGSVASVYVANRGYTLYKAGETILKAGNVIPGGAIIIAGAVSGAILGYYAGGKVIDLANWLNEGKRTDLEEIRKVCEDLEKDKVERENHKKEMDEMKKRLEEFKTGRYAFHSAPKQEVKRSEKEIEQREQKADSVCSCVIL